MEGKLRMILAVVLRVKGVNSESALNWNAQKPQKLVDKSKLLEDYVS